MGVFSAADRVRNACQMLTAPLGSAFQPRISALFATDISKAKTSLRHLAILQVGGSVFMSLVLLLGADNIVLLMMGPGFDESIAVLRWLAVVPTLVAMSNVLGVHTMLNLKMQSSFLVILILAGSFNVVLLFPLVSILGAQGAAIAVVLTEALVVICMAGVLRQKLLKTGESHAL
ncbi:MAG: hypothetical protein QM709_00025 [Spongiibacteraceae bacterium]